MAKISIKFEKTIPFGEIIHVMEIKVFTGYDRQRIDRGQRFCSTFARVRSALLSEVVKDVKDRIVTFA